MNTGGDDLMHRYLNGDLDGTELAAFYEELRGSAAMREQLAHLAADEVVLAEILLEDRAQARATQVRPGWGRLASWLWRRSPVRRPRWSLFRYAVLPLGAAAALILAILFGLRRDAGRVIAVKGELLANGVRTETGAGLKRGALLATAERSYALVELADSSKIELNSSSAVLVCGPGTVRLEQGEIALSVAPSASRPFTVETFAATAMVTGTTFLLRLEGKELFLAVAEGNVRFWTPSGEVTVSGGEESRVRERGKPSMPRKASIALLFSWSSIAAAAAGASSSDWPMAGQNPQRTGYTEDSPVPFKFFNKRKKQNVLAYLTTWISTFAPEQIHHAQPIIADGRVYIGSMQGNFYALDAKTGARVWVFSTDESKIGRPIPMGGAYDKGRVFFGCMDSRLYALDARTGARLWSVEASAPISASPLVAEDTVYIGDRWGQMVAVAAASGEIKWRRQLSWCIDSSAAYHDGRIFVMTDDAKLYCLSAADGSTIWIFDAPGGGFFRGHYPVVYKGNVLFRVNPTITGHERGPTPLVWFEYKGIDQLSKQVHEAMKPGGAGALPRSVVTASEGVKKFYEDDPALQTLYVLDESTGRQKYLAIHHLAHGFNSGGVTPPAVCRDGTALVPITWKGANFGRLDIATNRLVDINVESAMIRGCNQDEAHFVSVGKDRVFIKHYRIEGATNECVWDIANRSIAFFSRDLWKGCSEVKAQSKRAPKNEVSVIAPRWQPADLGLRPHQNQTGGGAMPISGNMFLHQERSTIFAWHGMEERGGAE